VPETLTPQPPLAGARGTVRAPFLASAASVRPNAAGQVEVQLHAGTLPSVTLISTWISGRDGLLAALATVFGPSANLTIGQTSRTELGLLLRTGPEEFMLVGDDSTDRTALLRATISAEVGAVTDLSHARCRIGVAGTACRSMLNKLFALDLREASLPVGGVALTGTHHVPAMLHRQGPDRFDLYVFSTYARDQLDTLVDAALEYGVRVELG